MNKIITMSALLFVLLAPYSHAIAIEASEARNAPVLDKTELQKQLGRKLTFKEKITIGIINRKLEKQASGYITAAAEPAKSNGMAIAGFVTGLVSLFFAGIILGILGIVFSAIALGRIRREPGVWNGKGLAVAGLILGIVGFVGGIIVVAILL